MPAFSTRVSSHKRPRLFPARRDTSVACTFLRQIDRTHQIDNLLSPCGTGLHVRADKHVVIPCLEGLDQVIQSVLLPVEAYRTVR